MELRHLRYFVAVAEEEHFGRAASRLNIAQPALSQQIKRLEQLVGARLFDRTTRSVALSLHGQALLPEARLALMHAERAMTAVAHSVRGDAGTLRLGFVSSAALSVVTQMTTAIALLGPAVIVELTEMTTDTQLEQLAAGNLDIGVVRDVLDADGLTVQPLVDERLWVAVHHSHDLATRQSVELTELAREEFVLFPRSAVPRLHDHIAGLCWSAGFRPRVVQEAVQFATLLGLVAADIGISVVPEPLRLLDLPGVRFVPIDDRRATSRVALATRPDAPALVRRAIELVATAFGHDREPDQFDDDQRTAVSNGS